MFARKKKITEICKNKKAASNVNFLDRISPIRPGGIMQALYIVKGLL